MLPSAINNLFGTQTAATPATPAKPAQPSTDNARAFGDMLSRELAGRNGGARPGDTEPAGRVPQETRNSRDQQARLDGRPAQQAAPPAQAQSTGPSAGPSTKPNAGDAPKAKPADRTREDDDEATVAGEVAGDAQAAATPAAAELLALVASMAPKAASATQATVATDAVIDPKTSGTKGPAATPAGVDPSDGDAATAAGDPAFDALLAQAAQSKDARDAGRTGKPADPGRPSAATGIRTGQGADGPAAVQPVAAGSPGLDAVASSKTDASPSTALLAADAMRNETNPVAAVPGANAALVTQIADAAGAGGADTLAPRVGTPAWDHALGQKVVWMASGAEQSASLMLNPPDLGPIQVVINVSNAQADASFTAAQPEVRQALEAAMPKLREMLSDAGISLGQTSVGAGSGNQPGGFGQAQARGARGAGATRSGATGGTMEATALARGAVRGIAGNGLVDTFA